RLFLERGFEAVTVDDIAAAAEVGRMTVFNHFPRKEDMFFDRDEEGRALLRDAIAGRETGVSPVEALRRLAHRLADEQAPTVRFTPQSQGFVTTVARSPTLQARARAIRDEIAHDIAQALAQAAGRPPDDADARLAAALLLATWTTALVQAHAAFAPRQDAKAARAVFLDIVDRGSRGVEAALAGTPLA
ncbi:MAG TPA: helix-turn-helix domain-containing protein, partial [Burkholderiaceae bacterium]